MSDTLYSKLAHPDQKRPEDVLATTIDHYGDRVGLAMSFQIGGVVLLDMIHRIGREVSVFSLDTGRLPEETYACADRIRQQYGIEIQWVFPRHQSVEDMIRSKGLYSFKENIENRKQCCSIRKVEPLTRALGAFDAWITGRRTDQMVTRRELKVIEDDPVHPGKVKINPLVHWSSEQLWEYIHEHNVPYHQLYDKGYLSIGCECCTRSCKGETDERAGRWWWESPEHKECGLHISYQGGSGI